MGSGFASVQSGARAAAARSFAGIDDDQKEVFEVVQRKTYDQQMTFVARPVSTRPSWTFLTNHAHVLLVISRNPEVRQRDIADAVGLTVGAVQRIVTELEAAGYLRHEKVGRRNRYEVVTGLPLRHPLEESHSIGELLTTLAPESTP